MNYFGRIFIVLVYITIVLGWHAFYFLIDFDSAYVFMFEHEQYKWDLVFIPLLSPFFWWLGYQYDKAKFLSAKDVLTGLYNRRFVSQITPKLFSQMDKKKKGFTISIIDCDNFKQINDSLGHKMGDLVLKNISDLLLESTCQSDVVARWGGDEFLIVSPYSNLKKSNATCNEIEEKLQQLSETMDINISVSIGLAVYPQDGDNIKDLLIIADRHMYENKTKGNIMVK